MKRIVSIILPLLLLLSACGPKAAAPAASGDCDWMGRDKAFHERYQLEEAVVMSRHNLRSPLTGKGSVTSRVTPHEWFSWTSGPGELSRKGAILESQMGQFFGQWIVGEGLWGLNAEPEEGRVRFYANSMQRTIATARSFAATFLPMCDIEVEHHYPVGTMDPVFEPALTRDDQEFVQTATAQMTAFGGDSGIEGFGDPIAPNLRLLEKVLDIRHSPAALGDTVSFCTTDSKLLLASSKEPGMKGGLNMARLAVDALILQYYENPDDAGAGFGRRLSHRQWESIGDILSWYHTILFGTEAVSRNVSELLAETIACELEVPERSFSFLCGHDSNLLSLLAAVGAEPYSLPETIEHLTPIGGKLVITKWKAEDGEYYAALDYVYASDTQIRTMQMLDMSNPPQSYPIHLDGLETNGDGLYRLSDVILRLRSL